MPQAKLDDPSIRAASSIKVMLTYPTLLVPFIAWLLMGYFKTVPKELEEQALGSVPVALIYSFFVKYDVAGLTAGAVKG
jgi:ABC-type maltose transport system permease subunit